MKWVILQASYKEIKALTVISKPPTVYPSLLVTTSPNPPNSSKVSVPELVWKVVVILDKPGLGLSDINSTNTLAFAITLPNTLILNPNPSLFTSNPPPYTGQDTNNDWTQAVINIAKLEQDTGYDFLSNIPTAIRDTLKTISKTDILNKISGFTTPAPLMAPTNQELPSTVIGTSSIVPSDMVCAKSNYLHYRDGT